MGCRHEGFHELRARYDRDRRMLIFFWTCETCGTRLSEFRRQAYRPHFDPQGNQSVAASHNKDDPGGLQGLAAPGPTA
jgi:hypothetical protein